MSDLLIKSITNTVETLNKRISKLEKNQLTLIASVKVLKDHIVTLEIKRNDIPSYNFK